ncbi:hypothetical protein CL628_04675 [bacterium]|nr:hypothetical protein [bacterium]|tara:strand:+ start:868 stop:1350 length:483 start_codon:yes stop_codon:yes gene_type:complete
MKMPVVTIVAGMTRDGLIGRGNSLPWEHHAQDMASFRSITAGKTVIMGRATFDSIGHPLPERKNIVLSRTHTGIAGCDVCASLPEALELAASYGQDVCIIGGASVYEQALPLADALYLSFIDGQYSGDTFFPEFDDHAFEITDQSRGNNYILATLKRKQT